MKIVSAAKPRLADYCSDILKMVLKLRVANDFGDEALFRDKVGEMLNKIELSARAHGISEQDIEQVKFPLIALIDEFVITSTWAQKENWLANPMQMQIYGRFDAGEEFFSRLNGFRINPKQNAGVLEVYYLCMVLGFKGKYSMTEQDKIRSIISDTYDDLYKSIDDFPQFLSPSGVPESTRIKLSKDKIPFWYFGIGATILGIIFYIIITLVSVNVVESMIEIIK